MDKDDLQELIKQGESLTVEFKSSYEQLNKDVFESVCAFLNRQGGHLLLGVNDNGEPTGVNPKKVEQLCKQFINHTNNPQQLSPTVRLVPQVIQLEDKPIIYIFVPESEHPHRAATTDKKKAGLRIFERNGDGDFDITDNHAQVAELYQRKQNVSIESKILPYLQLSDLRADLLDRARIRAKNNKPSGMAHPWAEIDNPSLLSSTQLYRKNLQSGEEGYTLAALLLFGKDEAINNALPHYRTDAILRRVDTDRYDDRVDIRTNLLDSYDQLMAFIEKHLPDPFHLEQDQRISLRYKIFREAVVNTLIHREYASDYPSRILIEPHQVYFINPNRPHLYNRQIALTELIPRSKNPLLAKMFREMGYAEELGSGVRNISKYTRIFSKGRDPQLTDGNMFELFIPVPDFNGNGISHTVTPFKQINLSKLPVLSHKFIGRAAELLQISEAITTRQQLIAVTAFGGVGKTALIRQWLDHFKKEKYGRFQKILAWSFVDQATQQPQADSSAFFATALAFFGASAVPPGPEQQGQLLADLVFGEVPALLILDGLEHVQWPLHELEGTLQDSALRQLLWAVKSSGYLTESAVIMTSRQPIVELQHHEVTTLIELPLLTAEEGATLLVHLGVHGTPEQHKQFSTRYKGHALTVALLAKLLVEWFQGDIALHDQLPELPSGGSLEARQAQQILQFYAQRYCPEGSLAQQFLYLLGLFNYPIGLIEQRILFERVEFAQPLAELPSHQFNQLVQPLLQAGILLRTEFDWDCHPLLRTYLGQCFSEQYPRAFQLAQQRLFQHYQRQSGRPQPTTLAELIPLYRAVRHGCLAEQYKKAIENVYQPRIRHGNQGYSLHQLGAYEQDLAALAAFFPQGWKQPVTPRLSQADQAWLLAQVSFCLMSLGRLVEAVEPRKSSLTLSIKDCAWEETAIYASDLVNLLMPLGRLTEALLVANRAVKHGIKAVSAFPQFINYAYQASCLHRMGKFYRAQEAFELAEDLQGCLQPIYPQLYSLPGFYYCLFLLDHAQVVGDITEVLARANYGLELAEATEARLDIALNHLIQARCHAALNCPDIACEGFDKALWQLRETHSLLFLPMFLLERANFYIERQQFPNAKTDLDDAAGIIQRSDMQLYGVDWHLAMCRYYQAFSNLNAAHQHRQKAANLIEVTGYALRSNESCLK